MKKNEPWCVFALHLQSQNEFISVSCTPLYEKIVKNSPATHFSFFFAVEKKIQETTKCCFKNCSQQSCVIFTEFSTEEPSLRIINTTDEIFGETKSVRPSVRRTFFYPLLLFQSLRFTQCCCLV